jgi:hypothetical protein
MIARITLAGRAFELAHGAVAASAYEVARKLTEALKGGDAAEIDFYRRALDEANALVAQFEAVLIGDTSQDAEPDEDDEED